MALSLSIRLKIIRSSLFEVHLAEQPAAVIRLQWDQFIVCSPARDICIVICTPSTTAALPYGK
jgi:hypothetical protein